MSTASRPSTSREPRGTSAKGAGSRGKSKTGLSACSLAASAWAKGRKSGQVSPEVYKVLAMCRARAKGGSGPDLRDQAAVKRQAKGSRAERLQALEARSDRLFEARRNRGGNARFVAADRSSAISRALHREQTGQTAGARGRGSVDRARRAAEKLAARHQLRSVAATTQGRLNLQPAAGRAKRGTSERIEQARKIADGSRSRTDRTGRGMLGSGESVRALLDRSRAKSAPGDPGKAPSSPATASPGREARNQRERDRIAQRVKELKAQTAKLRAEKAEQLAKADPSTHTEHAPGHIGELNRDLIHFDPTRFQYKQAQTDLETGSVGSLAGVTKWDHELAGVIQVWKDPANGKTYVVNGHNRLDLARKIGVDKVAVRFIAAKDATEARGKGALTNIAEGRGTATDAAKFFKDTGISKADLDARGIPLREKVADDGIALAALEPRLFRKVIDGDLTQERGAIIGRSGLTSSQQNALIDLVEKLPKKRAVTNEVLRELTDTVKTSKVKESGGFDLFGDTGEQSLALHKASLQAAIKTRLSREKKLFGTVAKSKAAEDLERGGNKIDTEQSGKIAKTADEALITFDQLKNLAGPISARLNRGAERLDAGENREKVHRETYQEILKHFREGHSFG